MGVLICVFSRRGRQACLVPVWEFRGHSLPEELVPSAGSGVWSRVLGGGGAAVWMREMHGERPEE